MNIPSQKSIQFAKESAERIGKIEITSEPTFDFNTESNNSNAIDERFIRALENGEHLNANFLKI